MKTANINDSCSRQALMRELMAHDFAALDLQLFLDTHPCDKKALKAFTEETEKTKELTKKYEARFGPITASGSDDELPWQWIQSPWTWEGGLY